MVRKTAIKVNRETFRSRMGNFWEGKFLVRSMTPRALRWVAAVVIFCLFSTMNTYRSLRIKNRVDRLDREIVELRMEYVSTASTLMGARRLSSIEERVTEEGLTLSIPTTPPIVIDK